VRRFGVALADIGTFLANPGSRLPAIVDQQIAALTRQIEQAGLLRTQLTRLKGQLDAGMEPDLAEWLTTLEQMTMYDKYFTKEQRERLPFFTGQTNPSSDEWRQIVASFHALMAANTPASSEQAQQLACRWMTMLIRDTGGDAELVVQLNAMNANEPSVRESNGITHELGHYVQEAFAAYRVGLFEKYLNRQEFAFLKANYGKGSAAWPALIARANKAMAAGAKPSDPAVLQIAREWMDLFISYAGTDPATHAKFRAAQAQEPGLRTGTFVTDELLVFVREAIAVAAQRKPA
jgi:hypothetical protein